MTKLLNMKNEFEKNLSDIEEKEIINRSIDIKFGLETEFFNLKQSK